MFRISAGQARRLGIATRPEQKVSAAGRRRLPSPAPAASGPVASRGLAAVRSPEPQGVVEIVVSGRPTAKEAVRSGAGRFYKPRRTSAYERRVRQEAQLAMRGLSAFSGPVAIEIVHYRPPLKGWSKVRRAAALAGAILPDTKPDMDNLEKSLFDGLKTVVFEDDAQVCEKRFSKRFGEVERVVVAVRALPCPGIRRGARSPCSA